MTTTKKELTLVQTYNQEIIKQTSDPATMRALLATTFSGLKDEMLVKKAILDGMIRGYSFQDFLKKKIYAVPFGNGYSLVQSIDDIRAKGSKSGVVGKSAPVYEFSADGKTIISCLVTVKKRFSEGYIGEFSATVFFDEYTTKKNLWITKPKTMIAKVAEMHALRMACPDELGQAYIEEELEMENERKFVTNLKDVEESGKGIQMGNLLKSDNKKVNNNEKETNKDEENQESGYNEPTVS